MVGVKVTSELTPGDVISTSGLRCLIVEPLEISKCHPSPPRGVTKGYTRWTRAIVLNREEVSNDSVPFGWTLGDDGKHYWIIQGNDWARWTVVEHVEGAPTTLDTYLGGTV